MAQKAAKTLEFIMFIDQVSLIYLKVSTALRVNVNTDVVSAVISPPSELKIETNHHETHLFYRLKKSNRTKDATQNRRQSFGRVT